MEVETYNDGTSKEIVFTDGMATGYTTVQPMGLFYYAANNGNPYRNPYRIRANDMTDNLTVVPTNLHDNLRKLGRQRA